MCMEKTRINHARTCVYNVNYHIVWSVKYRRAVLTGQIENYLKEILLQTAQEKGFVSEGAMRKYIEKQKRRG